MKNIKNIVTKIRIKRIIKKIYKNSFNLMNYINKNNNIDNFLLINNTKKLVMDLMDYINKNN